MAKNFQNPTKIAVIFIRHLAMLK